MAETSKRVTINIDSKDFELYQKLIKSTDYFKNNLHLFTCAVLVGKFIVEKPMSIKKNKSYIRVNDNANDENLVILKCLAIAAADDVNILTDEDRLYSYCEKYARTGIKQIYEWYVDTAYDFDVSLAKALLKAWKNIDLENIK